MGDWPNVATQFKNGQQAVEAGRKGGSVSSPEKKFAAKLRAMKKYGMKDSDTEWFLKTIEDPECNVFEIQELLNKIIETTEGKPSTQILAIQQKINLHKAHFGEKYKTENVNMNINMNMTIEEWEKRLMDNNGKRDNSDKDDHVVDL